MVSSFQLIIDVTATDINLSEREFRELIAPCSACLDALKGAFDKEPCTQFFYPPGSDSKKTKKWSVRYIVMISVGRERGKNLLELYSSIVRLIAFELPDFEVQAQSCEMKFS